VSYCRWLECDLYVFHDGEQWHVWTSDQKHMTIHPTREETLARLIELREQGYDVSEEAIERLNVEIAHGKQIWDIEAAP
jgi:hypothetical protein